MADICEQIRHVIFGIESEAAIRGLMDKLSPARVLGTAESNQPSHMNIDFLLLAVKRFQDLPEEEKAAWQN